MVEYQDRLHDDEARTSVMGWLTSFVIRARFLSSSRFVGNFMRAVSQVSLKRLNSP
jgi:hypothetical protein